MMELDYPYPWKAKRIADLVDDKRAGVAISPTDFASSGCPVAHKGDVTTQGYLDLSDRQSRFVRGECLTKNSAALVDEDWLVASLRDLVPSAPQLGIINALRPQSRVLLAQGTFGVKPNRGLVFPKYLVYQSISRPYRKAMTGGAVGSTQKHLRSTEFLEVRIPLPPLAEQEAIANALSDADAYIESLEKLIEKKRAIKKGAMQELLTGKRRLPGFSGEWSLRIVDSAASLKNGYAFKSETYSDAGEYSVVTIANVQDGFMDLSAVSKTHFLPNDLQSHHRLAIGDILISMTGNVGRVCKNAFENCLLNQRVGKVVPIGIEVDFLYSVLRDERFLKQMVSKAKGGAQPNLSAGDILEYGFHCPNDLAEQRAISEVLRTVDQDLAVSLSKLSKARLLKQGMMQELLTGRIRLV